MPELRAKSCKDEFKLTSRAMRWAVDTYGAPEGGATQSNREPITIRYRKPRKDESRLAMRWLTEWQLIEQVVDFPSDRFILPQAAQVIVKECGSPNAYWDPDCRELIVCYDLISGLNKLGRAPAVEKLAARFAATSK